MRSHAWNHGSIQPAEFSPARRGFTVIELIVVISIIGTLTSLLLPAILRARASARRAHCLSNVRQLALACTLYHDTKRSFPLTTCAVVWDNHSLCVSPHAVLLPFLEEDALYAQLDFAPASGQGSDGILGAPGGPKVTVPAFLCPSDEQVPGGTNYRACFGIGPALHQRYRNDTNGSGAFLLWRVTRMGEFTDGLSHTVLWSEKIIGDRNPGWFTPWKDYFYYWGGSIETVAEAEQACQLSSEAHPDHNSEGGTNWLAGGYAYTWYNHVFGPNSSRPDCSAGRAVGGSYGAYTARSWHPGGVNIAMADGSARFISEEIDLSLWRALSTRRGRELIPDGF